MSVKIDSTLPITITASYKPIDCVYSLTTVLQKAIVNPTYVGSLSYNIFIELTDYETGK